MKINLYADIFTGVKPEHLVFSQFPSQKVDGVKRIKVVVDVPDYFFIGEIDAIIHADSVKDV